MDGSQKAPLYRFGTFTFEPDVRKVMHIDSGEEKMLTHLESDMLLILAQKKWQVVPKADLYTGIWGTGVLPKPKIVDVKIHGLRKKLDALRENGGNHIVTDWGVGYHLSDEPKQKHASFREKRGRCPGIVKELEGMYAQRMNPAP